jgi:hypothetical protein
MNVLQTSDISRWEGPFSRQEQDLAIEALEHGRLLYCPALAFSLEEGERPFLSPTWSNGSRKNISFEPATGRLGGTTVQGVENAVLKAMMARYAKVTHRFLEGLLPSYQPALRQARTSFRPAEVEARPQSYKKDDRRLHTDAFPSRPTRGARILRIFSNVNPSGRDRVWRIGEPFEDMARQFLPRVSRPIPGAGPLLAALGLTKGRRTVYDHTMLQLHDRVKADLAYQQRVRQVQLDFPPESTWMVFTDQVLHAALSGQYLFEQTFHLPVAAQRRPELSPLRTLERLSGRTLAPEGG